MLPLLFPNQLENELVKLLRPFPGRVIHTQDLDGFLLDTIRHDIRQVMDDQFICTSTPACSTTFRMFFKLIDCNPYPLDDLKGGPRVFVCNIVLNCTQRGSGWLGPPNTHSQAFSYLLNILVISASLAKRPSSAALMPSFTRSICH